MREHMIVSEKSDKIRDLSIILIYAIKDIPCGLMIFWKG